MTLNNVQNKEIYYKVLSSDNQAQEEGDLE